MENKDLNSFLSCNKGLMIAPAGHGKTTAIADCLLQCSKETCHLILTHTHAGVAALRTKFKNRNVPMQKYQIETIMGFAQQLVLSFIGSSQLPKENDNDFFWFIRHFE